VNGDFSFVKILGKALKVWWIVVMIVSMGYSSITDLSWMYAYRNINWSLLGYQILAIPPTVLIFYHLYKLHPGIMGFCWMRLLKRLLGEEQEHYEDGTPKLEGGNINLLGTNIKFVGILVCLLLMTRLPSAAMSEEEWFRQGTVGWLDAIIRSVAFGFAHMLVGVPVVAAVVLSGVGLFYSYMYFQGGIELSAQAHFQYNLIIVVLLLIGVTIYSFIPSEQNKEVIGRGL
jgi:hypothetical protein